MDSSVSPKDEIWFLRVCHHISNAVYLAQIFVSLKSLVFPLVSPTFRGFQQYAVSLNTAEKKEAFGSSPVTVEASRLGPCDLSTSVGNIHPTGLSGSLELELALCLSRSLAHARTHIHTDVRWWCHRHSQVLSLTKESSLTALNIKIKRTSPIYTPQNISRVPLQPFSGHPRECGSENKDLERQKFVVLT